MGRFCGPSALAWHPDVPRRDQGAGAAVYGRDRAAMVYRGAVALLVLAMGLALGLAQGATPTPPNSSTSIVHAALAALTLPPLLAPPIAALTPTAMDTPAPPAP